VPLLEDAATLLLPAGAVALRTACDCCHVVIARIGDSMKVVAFAHEANSNKTEEPGHRNRQTDRQEETEVWTDRQTDRQRYGQ
jgi:hypothetical protein